MRLRLFLGLSLLERGGLLAGGGLGDRHEGIRHVFTERDGGGPGGTRESEVALNVVEDRIEIAQPDEEHVPARRIERGHSVVQHPAGDLRRLPRMRIADLDHARLWGVREAVGEPAAIGRPGDALQLAEFTAVEDTERWGHLTEV